jgi:hypothetical protein
MGRAYIATAAGRICKVVPCEGCLTTYFYEMDRAAEGRGDSDQAKERAEEYLRQKLAQEFDIVPCPHCGQYQSYMTPEVRWGHLHRLRVLGILLLLVAIVFFGGYLLMFFSSSYTAEVLLRMRVCLAVAVALGVNATGLLIVKFVLTRRYDPNNAAELEARLRLAGSRCISKDEFERIREDAIDDAIKAMKEAELPEFLRKKKE